MSRFASSLGIADPATQRAVRALEKALAEFTIGGGTVGPQGPQGPAGPTGATGATGSTGPAGPAPSGTGFVHVTGGVLDTPANLAVDNLTIIGGGWTGSPLMVNGALTAGVVGGGIWSRPQLATIYDDEFDTGTALAGAWSVTSGTLSATAIDPYASFAAGGVRHSYNSRRPNWLMLQPDSSGTQTTITKAIPALTGTDFAVWMHGCFNHRAATAAANNDYTFGMTMSSDPYDANNEIIIFLNESDAGTIQLEFLKRVGGVVTSVGVSANIAAADHTPFEGVLLQKIGTNYYGWGITNNGSALYLGTTAFATTIGRAGFFCSNTANNNPGNAILGVDFIRFVTGTTFLP